MTGWTHYRHSSTMERIGGSVWEVLTRYIRGTVVVAFMDAAGIGVAVLVLGVPLVASLTLIVFIGAFVPIVGAAVSGAWRWA